MSNRITEKELWDAQAQFGPFGDDVIRSVLKEVRMESARSARTELNAKIAEKVFGWKTRLDDDLLPDFSGDVGCAWKAVEAMREKGYSILMKIDDEYAQRIAGKKTVWVSFTKDSSCFGEHCETFPESVCRAAIAALEDIPLRKST